MAIDKNSVMKEAQKYVAKGQFDKAIAEWKKLLQESPDDPNIYNTIGDLCLKKDAKAGAVDAYQKAADILAGDGFTSKAIALYKKVLNIDPKKIEVHLALGDLNAEKGLTGNALESYKIAADNYIQQKNMSKALGIYQKMADLNSANLAFRIKLGDMYAKEKMVAEASTAYLAAADVYISKNAFKDARQLFEKVLSIDPSNMTVYHRMGKIYLEEGKFGEACKALKPAFEGDPSNKEIGDTYLDALSKAGKDADAEQIIRKVLAADAKRLDLREKLINIYLGRNDHDRAFNEAVLICNAKTEEGDSTGAEKALKSFIAANPDYAAARQKLAEFYAAAGRGEDAAPEFLRTAEIHAETGDYAAAKAFVMRALEIAPAMEEAKKFFSQLEAQEAPVAHAPVQEEQQPIQEEPQAFQEEPQPEAKQPVAALGILEENPAINQAFTEIDVLAKYGLVDKALEQLQALADKYPQSPQVRMRLEDAFRSQGKTAKASEQAIALADIYLSQNMTDQAGSVLRSALKLDPNNPALFERLGMSPEPAPAWAAQEEPTPEPQAYEPPEAAGAPRQPFFQEAAPAPAVGHEEPFDEPPSAGEIAFEGLDSGIPPLEEAPAPVESAEEISAPEPVREEIPSFAPEEPVIERRAEHAPPEAAKAAPTPVSDADISEIWAEAEFYFQQGLFDEAKKHYAKIISLRPGETRAINRLSEISREEEETREFTKLAEAVEGLEEAASALKPSTEEMPMTESDEQAVRNLMQEISQLKKQEAPSPVLPGIEEEVRERPQAKPPRQPQKPAASTPPRKEQRDEEFFDLGEELNKETPAKGPQKPGSELDDFFDLAAELREDLSNVAVPAKPTGPVEEQSLDEIFQEFKRGVEQQTVKEDTDTHYNLGVAYKEMGLLDDAIAEFLMTPSDEPKFIQSRHMLGLCYMEKGEYQKAAVEIQQALTQLENSSIDDEQASLGMHYDLGLASQGAGNVNSAISEFQIVHALDPNYRDAANKLRELKQGDFISLDQLKGDIEREISSKFLEEGERIQREEKNRKSERVRN